MTEAEERAYQLGRRAMARSIVSVCHACLAPDEQTLEGLKLERSETVAMLRRACEEFGENDWRDNLQLSDVIEKNLLPHLRDMTDEVKAMEERVRLLLHHIDAVLAPEIKFGWVIIASDAAEKFRLLQEEAKKVRAVLTHADPRE